MLIALGGGRAEDGRGGAALARHLQQLRLDVVDRLGKVEEEVCLIRVLPVIDDLKRELQSLVTSDRVLVEISMRRKMVAVEKCLWRLHSTQLSRGILPAMDNFEIWDADVVVTAIFLDVDSVLGHQRPVLAAVVLSPEHGREAGEVAILVTMIGKLNNELSLERGELVTDVGLQCLISVTWVNTNNGGETLNTYDEINIIGLAERNFFRQHKILAPFIIILPRKKEQT